MMSDISNIVSNGNWKEIIYSQLQNRDKRDSGVVKDLIHQQNVLRERCESFRLENLQLNLQLEKERQCRDSGGTVPLTGDSATDKHHAVVAQLEQKVYRLQEEVTELNRTKADTAQQLMKLTTAMQEKEALLQDRQHRIDDLQSEVLLVREDLVNKKEQIEEISSINQLLRDEYTTLNMTFGSLENKYHILQDEHGQLVARWIEYKSKDAERLNAENEKHFKVRQRAVEEALREAVEDKHFVVMPEDVGAKGGETINSMLGTLACPCAVVPSRCFYSMEAHASDLYTLRVSRNGQLLATAGEDRKLKLWHIRRDTMVQNATLLGSNAGINCVDFSADDAFVMAASSDCASRIWSIPDHRIRHTLTGHSAKVTTCKFLAENNKVITAGHDRTIKIWDLRSKACSRTIFVGSSCNDLTVPISSPGLVYSGHHDKKLRMYDLRTNTDAKAEVFVHEKVTSVTLLNMNNCCLVCCRDNVLRLIDVRMNEIIKELSAPGMQLGSDLSRACVSPDDCYAAVGSSDGSVHVWCLLTGALQATLQPGGHTSCVMACSWTPDGQVFFSCERSKKVIAWSSI